MLLPTKPVSSLSLGLSRANSGSTSETKRFNEKVRKRPRIWERKQDCRAEVRQWRVKRPKSHGSNRIGPPKAMLSASPWSLQEVSRKEQTSHSVWCHSRVQRRVAQQLYADRVNITEGTARDSIQVWGANIEVMSNSRRLWRLRPKSNNNHQGDDFYMDDYLDSFDSPEEAIRVGGSLKAILSRGDFNLTK